MSGGGFTRSRPHCCLPHPHYGRPGVQDRELHPRHNLTGGCAMIKKLECESDCRDRAEDHLARGESYAREGAHLSAIRCFDRAIGRAPTLGRGYLTRGRSFAARGEFQRMFEDFWKAFQTDSALAHPCFDIIGLYDQAISMAPSDPATYFQRGRAYRVRGEFHSAIADLSRAVKYHSDFAEAYVELSRACTGQVTRLAS